VYININITTVTTCRYTDHYIITVGDSTLELLFKGIINRIWNKNVFNYDNNDNKMKYYVKKYNLVGGAINRWFDKEYKNDINDNNFPPPLHHQQQQQHQLDSKNDRDFNENHHHHNAYNTTTTSIHQYRFSFLFNGGPKPSDNLLGAALTGFPWKYLHHHHYLDVNDSDSNNYKYNRDSGMVDVNNDNDYNIYDNVMGRSGHFNNHIKHDDDNDADGNDDNNKNNIHHHHDYYLELKRLINESIYKCQHIIIFYNTGVHDITNYHLFSFSSYHHKLNQTFIELKKLIKHEKTLRRNKHNCPNSALKTYLFWVTTPSFMSGNGIENPGFRCSYLGNTGDNIFFNFSSKNYLNNSIKNRLYTSSSSSSLYILISMICRYQEIE